MLARKNFHRRDFHRRDAATQRNIERRRKVTGPWRSCILFFLRLRVSAMNVPTLQAVKVAQRICLPAVIFFLLSCGSKPTDPRTVIPADALVYLEAQDVGKVVSAITENEQFKRVAAKAPDLSVLNGVKIAVAVTGFETSEQKVTDENAVLSFQPRFVAVIETNAWGWQAGNFVENSLGEFVNEAYGGAIELVITTRQDGEYYVWTSPDGRKAYALQQGSLVFFGNDESAIERCQAVKRGEADSIAGSSKLGEGERLAFGYVSPEGVGQIANIAGISLAIGASEEEEVKSFVAGVLPQILRNSVKEVTWTALRTDVGVEDKVVVGLDDESGRVFSETLVPAAGGPSDLVTYVPPSAGTATRYVLRDPQIAWRSVVLTARKKIDETSGGLIAAFSGSLFEPYGIEDSELFLSAVRPEIVTVKLTGESEDAAVIATATDMAKVRGSVAKEIKLTGTGEQQFGGAFFKSEDGESAAAFVGDKVLVGDAETILKCLEAKQTGGNSDLARLLTSSDAAAVTVASDADSVLKVIDLLGGHKEDAAVASVYRTETRFNRNGIERRTISSFGLIGTILSHLVQE